MRLAALTAAIAVVAGLARSAAQIVVPPAASLDLQVPVPPMPVRVGGRLHLAYELHITNFRTADLVLTGVDVVGEKRDAPPLASYRDDLLRSSLARVGARRDAPDAHVIPSGMRAVLFVWLALDEGSTPPGVIRHRVSFEVLAPSGRDAGQVEGGSVVVRREAPIALDPPLRGGPWVAIYDPASAGGHRRAIFAIDGRARIPARFAVDWVKLADDTHGYGADVLAVADATVADAVDRFPEPTVPITLDNAAGNHVTLNLGAGRFAFYEHLQPGSIKVKTGQTVRSGDVLASLGASGSVSSGPHLHFHVGDANSTLASEGLPYVFRHFEVLGAFRSLDAFAKGDEWVAAAGQRRLELPAGQTVIRF
jgi:murein DD-endopeptidase